MNVSRVGIGLGIALYNATLPCRVSRVVSVMLSPTLPSIQLVQRREVHLLVRSSKTEVKDQTTYEEDHFSRDLPVSVCDACAQSRFRSGHRERNCLWHDLGPVA